MTAPRPCPQRFFQDPYSTTFSSFSRVTNFFRGALQPHQEGASPDLPPAPDDEPEPGFEVISCVSIRVDTAALWRSPWAWDCIYLGLCFPSEMGIITAPPSSGFMSDLVEGACSLCIWCLLLLGGFPDLGGDFFTDPAKEMLPAPNVLSVRAA